MTIQFVAGSANWGRSSSNCIMQICLFFAHINILYQSECIAVLSTLAACIKCTRIKTRCCSQTLILSHPEFPHCAEFKQLPLSLSPLVNLIALSWEIRWRPVSCSPSLRGPQRHSFQDEIKMASVNPAFQLQAVIQRVSPGTGWGCSSWGIQQEGQIQADTVAAWHNANALLPGNVSEDHYLWAIWSQQDRAGN